MATQSKGLNARPNHVFLSHSSKDKHDFVDGLYHWLTRKADLKVWYDRGLGSGQVSSNLDEAIETCRSAVIVLSENAVQSPWVRGECDRIFDEHNRHNGDFRIATMRLQAVEPPGLLKSFKHIDVTNGSLSPDSAALLMESLFGGKDSSVGKPIYVSRGWKPSERKTADTICESLQRFGLKLMCDWVDQPHYDQGRIRAIMEGTGGLAAILPHRGNRATSSYIVKEIGAAQEMGLPVLIFAHRDVELRPEWGFSKVAVYAEDVGGMNCDDVASLFGGQIEEFEQSWRSPAGGEHVFLGHSLEESIDDNFLMARRLLSRITGLPVEVGGLVHGIEAQSEIVRLIQRAAMCLIDISNLTYQDLPDKINFALNSCIEAGIALGANKNLYLTCQGKRRSPPFMFRNKQVTFYEDALELVGALRQISDRHRRMVL